MFVYILLDFFLTGSCSIDIYTKELVMNKYSNAMTNLKELEERRCTVLHDVNGHSMILHPLLHLKLFDRIVFNFPHAGFIWSECDKRQIE